MRQQLEVYNEQRRKENKPIILQLNQYLTQSDLQNEKDSHKTQFIYYNHNSTKSNRKNKETKQIECMKGAILYFVKTSLRSIIKEHWFDDIEILKEFIVNSTFYVGYLKQSIEECLQEYWNKRRWLYKSSYNYFYELFSLDHSKEKQNCKEMNMTFNQLFLEFFSHFIPTKQLKLETEYI